MIKAVLFDYDDTLENFAPAEAVAEVHIAERVAFKYSVKPREFLKLFNEVKVKRIHKNNVPEENSRVLWITETLSRMKVALDYCYIDELVDEYWKIIEKEAVLFPNSLKVLKTLKKKYKLGLITDSDGNKHIKLSRVRKIGIMNFFDVVITSDDAVHNKPDKTIFLNACKALGVKPGDCLFIGDSMSRDIVPAKRLGMKTAWTTECLRRDSKSVADFSISDIGEVLDIVRSL